MQMRSTVLVAIIGTTLGITACGDDQPATPSGPTPPSQPTVSSLFVRSGGETTLSVGDTLTVTACARYSDGSENCSIPAAWQSLQPEVATVEAGTITAVAAGQATIQASYQGRTATLQITVEVAEPTFAFDPIPPATINEGDPKNDLIRRCCLIHLKNSSTCQRCRYNSATDRATSGSHRRRWQPAAADHGCNLIGRIRRTTEPGR